ncbi:MAG: ATP-binding protein [Bacteroidaceae bacterium]|nr:ATP-binding protein [Bacteroidaceae bacterium]
MRRLRQMLEFVRMRDFTLQYSSERLFGEERRVTEEINAIMREFREMEHRHESESQLYEALLSEVDAVMIVTDDAGNVHWMNRAAIEGLCGFRFDNLDCLSALHPSLPSQFRKLRKGGSQLLAFTMPDGEERQYAASLTSLFIYGMERRLYNLQSVAAIMKQGEIMAQQKLIRVLTHEIMNSLTPIVSLSDTLSNGCMFTEEEKSHALSVISRRANGLMQFVQQYRRLSGIAAPVLQRVRIVDFISGLQVLVASFPADNCDMRFDVRCPDRTVNIDRAQMEQVLINLLKNAVETEASDVCMTVSASDDGHWLVLSVEDNGGGFPPEVSDNLFTPFFTTKPGGQGIGLAVCRQIVGNHGGMIGAECVGGGTGARFTVRLPL